MNPHLKSKRHLSEADPVLAEIITKVKLRKRNRPSDYFQSLCRSIIGQQLSVKAAATIVQRFYELFPSGVPTPKAVLKAKEEKLRKAGLSNSKIKYIKNLAQFALEKESLFNSMKELKDEEVIEFLTQVKGIGKWTAEMFLIFTLGREDVFSHGDLGLQNAIKKVYKLKNPNERVVKKISDKWKPYRSYASLYLWASLDNE